MIVGSSPLLAGAVDAERWGAICSDDGLPRHSARLLARFACGMFSPHISRDRLSKHPLFGSMSDHNFNAVLKVCPSSSRHACTDNCDCQNCSPRRAHTILRIRSDIAATSLARRLLPVRPICCAFF